MVDTYPQEWAAMVKVTKEEEDLMWLTAISSINLTHSLVIYFYMNEGEVSPQHTKVLAGRTQFKNFCKLNSFDKRCFFEINSFGLKLIFKLWTELVASMGKDNVVGLMGSFSKVMDQAKEVIHAVMAEEIRDLIHMIYLLN